MIIIERHRNNQNARGVLPAIAISSRCRVCKYTNIYPGVHANEYVLLKKMFVHDIIEFSCSTYLVLKRWLLVDKYAIAYSLIHQSTKM